MCVPTSVPLTQTVHDWSTAPKCSSTRCVGVTTGVANSRRYQSHSSGCSCRPTPDRSASGENGTTMGPS